MPHKNKSLQRPPPKRKKKAKRLEVEAAAVARGTEIGKAQAHRKKSLIESAKEHIGRMIDNTSLLDVAAVATGTILIHGIIITSPELQQRAATLIPIGLLGAAGIPWTMGLEQLRAWGVFGRAEPLKDDWPYWIAAFFIAFLLVKNGAQLLGLLDRGIGQIVGMMLA